MTQFNRFIIRNDFAGTMIIVAEPEAAQVSLASGQEVQVSEEFDKHPVTLFVSISQEGFPIISVWPGDGDTRVEKDGVDVLDLR